MAPQWYEHTLPIMRTMIDRPKLWQVCSHAGLHLRIQVTVHSCSALTQVDQHHPVLLIQLSCLLAEQRKHPHWPEW